MGVRADVYQLVALNLGQARTTGPDSDSTVSLRLAAIYDHEAKMFLEGYPWNFAASLVQLTASEPTPDDWAYGFPLPDRCVRVLKVDNQADMRKRGDIPYTVRKGRILTNSETTWLNYIDGAYADLEGAWPEHPLDAFAWQCTDKIKPAFELSESRREEIRKAKKSSMSKARLWDAQQTKVLDPPLSYFQRVRMAQRVAGRDG